MTRRVVAMLVLGLLSSASACRGDSSSEARRDDPPDAAAPIAPVPPPAGFRSVAGAGFTIAAPPSYASETRTGSNGEPVLVLTAGADGATVSVVRDTQPRAPAADQAATLEKARRTVDKATEVDRQRLSWPGTTDAYLVRWVETQAAGSGHRPVRVWQLLAQVDEALIIDVVASAPEEAFERLQLDTVLRTFRPAGPAA